jgi:hypothetical protein
MQCGPNNRKSVDRVPVLGRGNDADTAKDQAVTLAKQRFERETGDFLAIACPTGCPNKLTSSSRNIEEPATAYKVQTAEGLKWEAVARLSYEARIFCFGREVAELIIGHEGNQGNWVNLNPYRPPDPPKPPDMACTCGLTKFEYLPPEQTSGPWRAKELDARDAARAEGVRLADTLKDRALEAATCSKECPYKIQIFGYTKIADAGMAYSPERKVYSGFVDVSFQVLVYCLDLDKWLALLRFLGEKEVLPDPGEFYSRIEPGPPDPLQITYRRPATG